jgi:hypothetical protein
MHNSDRRKRPFPERTEPERSFSASFGVGIPKSPAGTDSAGPHTSSAAPEETAFGAVNDAYRLIDEYLRQGQRMAESLWLPLTGGANAPSGFGGAPERLLRGLGDMTLAWVELMQQWTTQMQPSGTQAPTGSAGPFAANTGAQASAPHSGGPHSAGTGPAVATPSAHHAENLSADFAVRVEASGRVEVSVKQTISAEDVVVGALRSFDEGASPITSVTLERGPGGERTLAVVVPPGHSAGVYNGLLAERGTQRPVGTISLRIF